jgi:hypothetical protein
MTRSDGCQIGRINFHFREFNNAKLYKDKLTGPNILMDESDELYARLEYFLICGGKLHDYSGIVSMAIGRIEDDLEAKKAARALLPDKKRKGLQGKDLRREVRRLVRELAKEEVDERNSASSTSANTVSAQDHEIHGGGGNHSEVPDNGSLAATV